MRRLAWLACAFLAACSSTQAAPSAARGDVDALVSAVEAYHPDPWHATSRADFQAAAARAHGRLDESGPEGTLVELMRLGALLGERDGHSGIFPLDPGHRRTLHLYPVRLYAFPDGLRVVGELGRLGLVGRRLDAIGGVPVEQVVEAARPLVPRDNEQSRLARLPQFLVVAEVLRGLGVLPAAGRAIFSFEGRDVALAPVAARRYAAAFPDLAYHYMVPQGLPRRARPRFLARRDEPAWTATLDRGRAVLVAYNRVSGSSDELAARLRKLAAPGRVRRVIVDLRHNPGGEVSSSVPLRQELARIGRRKRVVVLVSRTTFSAAILMLVELARTTPFVVVGEASGGSPRLYADSVATTLPETGWAFHVAEIWWGEGVADERLAFEPDVAVETRWQDLVAGRDRVLERALRA